MRRYTSIYPSKKNSCWSILQRKCRYRRRYARSSYMLWMRVLSWLVLARTEAGSSQCGRALVNYSEHQSIPWHLIVRGNLMWGAADCRTMPPAFCQMYTASSHSSPGNEKSSPPPTARIVTGRKGVGAGQWMLGGCDE